MVSERNNAIGISKTTFVVGLVVAILASSLISSFVAITVIQGQGEQGLAGEQGPPGPKGDKGDIGPKGETGPAGQDANVEADLSAYLKSDLIHIDSKTILTFTGFMINFGVQAAYNVQMKFTFTIYGGEFIRTYDLTPMWGHDVRSLWIQFSFDLEFDSYSYKWTIIWD